MEYLSVLMFLIFLDNSRGIFLGGMNPLNIFGMQNPNPQQPQPQPQNQPGQIGQPGQQISFIPMSCLIFRVFCPNPSNNNVLPVFNPILPIFPTSMRPIPIPITNPPLAKCDPKNSQTKSMVVAGSTFEGAALTAHNYYRHLHKSPNLQIDPTLTAVAQAYATKLAIDGFPFQHSPEATAGKYGENLAMLNKGPGNIVMGNEPVDMWYCEINDYDFNNPSLNPTSGKEVKHFTAVVWKESSLVGIGMAIGSKGETFIVANYLPVGNVINVDRIKANVLSKN